MSYTSDREQARADRAFNLRHTKSFLSRINYEYIMNELYDIKEECSDMAYFDDEEIISLLANDGESDNEFRIIAQELYETADALFERLRSESWHTGTGFNVSEVFDEVLTATSAIDERRLGYDTYLEEDCELTEFECGLAKEASKKRLMKYTKEQILNIFGECFDITWKWLDLVQGYDYLRATLGVMKDDKSAILKAIKRVDNAYNTAESNDFLGKSAEAFDRIISDLLEDVWVI